MTKTTSKTTDAEAQSAQDNAEQTGAPETTGPAGTEQEIGGPTGPEPTRYGDWEKKGRCIDF